MNILIRFSHNLGDAKSSTVLGYVSSYIRTVEMGQYHDGVFLNTQVFSHFRFMGQAHNFSDGDRSRYFTDKDTNPV
jgi:hypothetical protein